jgi:hypothetical protein
MQNYCEAQAQCIKKMRLAVDADPDFFDSKDWRNLTPKVGRYISLSNKKKLLFGFLGKAYCCKCGHRKRTIAKVRDSVALVSAITVPSVSEERSFTTVNSWESIAKLPVLQLCVPALT